MEKTNRLKNKLKDRKGIKLPTIFNSSDCELIAYIICGKCWLKQLKDNPVNNIEMIIIVSLNLRLAQSELKRRFKIENVR